MAKYPTDWAYYVGYSLQDHKYKPAKQSKFSSHYCGDKFGTEEEAQKEANKMNKQRILK